MDSKLPAGQFAFTPATQRTTVVTTTTTTVSLPPFVFHPTDRRHKDPKKFPLAAAGTPAELRNFAFSLQGQTATFREASAREALRHYHKQQAALADANGVLVQSYEHEPIELHGHVQRPTRAHQREAGVEPVPPSIARAAEIAASETGRKFHSSGHALWTDRRRSPRKKNKDELRGIELPVTPGTETGPQLEQTPVEPTSILDIASCEITDPSRPRRAKHRLSAESGLPLTRSSARSSLSDSLISDDGSARTPPVEGERPSNVAESRHLRSRLSRPQSGLLAFSHQDASLPSPSLSPVTAAANLARNRLLATQSSEEQIVPSGSITELGDDSHKPVNPDMPPPPRDARSTSAQRSLMDIPEMIRMFDCMPEELQSYVSFQLLKCCSKTTLKSLSGAINQALKVDPFEVFPVEVGLKITSLLGAKDLSTAAQVSRRWRHLVNSDELTWKKLMDEEGLTVSEGELQRAIVEGWGWQSAGRLVFERDLRESVAEQPPTSGPTGAIADRGDESHSSRTGLKRKASTHGSGGKRQKHRQPVAPSQSKPLDKLEPPEAKIPGSSSHPTSARVTASGPFGYASAAAKIMPKPSSGLASLQDMHLYRSLYQRQQFIRQSWLGNGAPPKHMAFGAHNRHVVTCLLFDDNRIITGSDDNHIHIYDTKTGVLKSRLEGHDGGVWALACDGDTLVSGSTDRTVRIWNIATEECKQTFQGHTSTVRCLVILKPEIVGRNADGSPIIHPEEPIIITGSRDSTLRVWGLPPADSARVHSPMDESDNPYAIRLLQGHHNSVRAIAAHGDSLVSGSYDHTVRLWKISTGETVHRLSGHNEKVYSVVLDHVRNRCISGSMDKLVKVWSLDTGDCLFNLMGHTLLVGLLDLNRDLLVSAAADSALRVWDPVNGRCISKLEGHTSAITCFQHDGEKVVSGADQTLKMWDIHSGKCIRNLLEDLSGVWQVKFDQRRCVAAVQRDTVTYIEVLDFGAARDGVPAADLGRRIMLDENGREVAGADVTAGSRPRAAVATVHAAGAVPGPTQPLPATTANTEAAAELEHALDLAIQ